MFNLDFCHKNDFIFMKNNTFFESRKQTHDNANINHNEDFKKLRTLSPRTMLFTTNKLPEVKYDNNLNCIKDIADELQSKQPKFNKSISKFKSFG